MYVVRGTGRYHAMYQTGYIHNISILTSALSQVHDTSEMALQQTLTETNIRACQSTIVLFHETV